MPFFHNSLAAQHNRKLSPCVPRTNLAVETLSRLETGALTNPTWKTLGTYAAALGLQVRLLLEETTVRNDGQ